MTYCEQCGKVEKGLSGDISNAKKALALTRELKDKLKKLDNTIDTIGDADIKDAFRFSNTIAALTNNMSRADTLIQNRIREAEHRNN